MTSQITTYPNWTPPADWVRIDTIDAHTAGEPLRIIFDDYPALEGESIVKRIAFARRHHDDLRTALMWEPRGHADMYGCIICPPVSEAADFGVVFLHNEGYSTMCGHGIIAVATVAVTTGMVAVAEPETSVVIDSPAGLVRAWVLVSNSQVQAVRFHNVPSYVVSLDDSVDVAGLGHIQYDLAFGGAYYAFVDVAQVGLTCLPKDHDALVAAGRQIKRAVITSRKIEHPTEPDLGFLYGTIFIGPPEDPSHHSRNVCIFADGEVDRSPTGTGVSARMALHYARQEVVCNQPIIIESIIGTTFTGRVINETTFGPHAAIVPEVQGRASITGRNQFLIDPDDPLATGFILR